MNRKKRSKWSWLGIILQLIVVSGVAHVIYNIVKKPGPVDIREEKRRDVASIKKVVKKKRSEKSVKNVSQKELKKRKTRGNLSKAFERRMKEAQPTFVANKYLFFREDKLKGMYGDKYLVSRLIKATNTSDYQESFGEKLVEFAEITLFREGGRIESEDLFKVDEDALPVLLDQNTMTYAVVTGKYTIKLQAGVDIGQILQQYPDLSLEYSAPHLRIHYLSVSYPFDFVDILNDLKRSVDVERVTMEIVDNQLNLN